jgi:hypothetical protein
MTVRGVRTVAYVKYSSIIRNRLVSIDFKFTISATLPNLHASAYPLKWFWFLFAMVAPKIGTRTRLKKISIE